MISNDPHNLWKTHSANNKTHENKANINELQWYSYFRRFFSQLIPRGYGKFESELINRLLTPGKSAFVMNIKDISDVIRKLRKKKIMGCDGVCALHLHNVSYYLICHLSLLFRIVFCRVVPDSFF